MMKTHRSWVQFINKLKNSNENIFVLIDTRFESEHEQEFEKLWDGPVFYNSYSSNQRGLIVLLKDSFTAKNIEFRNILKGDYSRLTLTMGESKILIKCCYAPNSDMTPLDSESENYSDIFFKTIFDDSEDTEYDLTLMVGDFNVAPDHNKDTLGYFHVNNPNTRLFMERMKSLNMLTDVFRQKHPDLRKFTFSKKQARNYTKARLDYFLINDDALDLVSKVGIGRETTLSDHNPIYLHLNLSRVNRGRGFWRLNNDFLREPEFIFGMNHTIERVINQYTNNEGVNNPDLHESTSRPLLISHSLLHDVLLIESRSFCYS